MGLGDKMFSGMAWSIIDRVSIQLVQFILGVILARILAPEEYGVIAILVVFIVLSGVFIDSGFTKALIQKKDRTEDDNSTVFIFNIGISIVCYLLLWIIAPFIADFYEIQELTLLLRVMALSLIVGAVKALPTTLFVIDLNFRTLTKINLITVVVSGGIAIYLAYIGWGVWALVWQTILKAVIGGILTWTIVKWKPNWVFSLVSFRQMFSYGYKLMVSQLLGSFFSNLNSLLIGKYIGARDLGFYSRGIQFSDVVYSIFSSALNNVLLPGLAPVQDDKKVLVSMTRTIIKTSALITLPVFLGLAVLAEPIILVILTKKWAFAIPIMQIFCIARFITTVVVVNINLLYVIGRTDLVLRQQYLCIAVRVVLVIIALQYGIIYIALAELASTSIHFFINSYYPGKFMNYGGFSQIKDLLKIILSGLAMALIAYFLMSFINNDFWELIIVPPVGMLLYWGTVYFLKIPEYNIAIEKAKSFMKGKS